VGNENETGIRVVTEGFVVWRGENAETEDAEQYCRGYRTRERPEPAKDPPLIRRASRARARHARPE
jgi:hypothetical protein